MQNNAISTENLKGEADTLLFRTEHMLSIAKQNGTALSTAAILSEIELANLEELELKLDVYRVFMGLFAGSIDFTALESPHREVHENARKAVAFYRKGQLNLALDALRAMETSNLDVMQRLRKMIRERNRKETSNIPQFQGSKAA